MPLHPSGVELTSAGDSIEPLLQQGGIKLLDPLATAIANPGSTRLSGIQEALSR